MVRPTLARDFEGNRAEIQTRNDATGDRGRGSRSVRAYQTRMAVGLAAMRGRVHATGTVIDAIAQ
jgi:hypothetical protein